MLQAQYLDAAQSVEERVRDLLSRMTVDEKLAQLGGVWSTSLIENGGRRSGAPKRHRNRRGG